MARTQRYQPGKGYTLTEVMVALAIVSILLACAGIFFPHYLEKARTTEAQVALSDVKRLEEDFYARTGTYTSDLSQLGFRTNPPLQYHTMFLQVEKGAAGWGYMALVWPNYGSKSGNPGWFIAQGASGRTESSLPGQSGGGDRSACGAWTGWSSMQGGTIEGEEGIAYSSSGTPPCGARKIVDHGKGPGGGADPSRSAAAQGK